jgi:anhydro-N-acetylmuramic acid kinase
MSVRTMTVAGVMSGTSADGIDVALVRMAPANPGPQMALLAHEGFRFPAELRARVLAAMNASKISTAELARLNWRLGIAYAEAVLKTLRRHRAKLDLVGCHGQTLYHQPQPELYAGSRFACTWQAGEAQVIAARLGVPVVSNFRPADLLAGGQGAPLVPLLDYVLFADARRGRVLQNIGGIANLTAIPPGAGLRSLIAFDTGPGNMVIDWLAQNRFKKAFDQDGALAATGSVIEPVLRAALRQSYFRLRPPKSAGREQFGREYAADLLMECRRHGGKDRDALATATALTAETIARGYERHAMPAMKGRGVDFIVSGGGVHNRTLVEMLRQRLEPMSCVVMSSDDFLMPAAAKEAAAFALLAWMSWNHRPGNVPAATGAKRSVVLGQVSYG